MKNRILIYIFALSIMTMSGCSGAENNENIVKDEAIIIEKDAELEKKDEENLEKDLSEDLALDKEKELSIAVSPKNSGVKFDIDLDTYKSVLPLTEDWKFYHDAEEVLRKELLTINGEVYDHSVLFFECSEQYVAIVSDKNNFAATFIALMDQSESGFEVKFLERFRYSFNSAKEEVLVKEKEIILMTQFPFSAYSLFGKFIHEDNNIIYDSLVDYDSSIAYYTEFMELLNEGAMEKAMQLEDYSSYPFSYETLYFKSGNLAIKKSLEFAKVEFKKENNQAAKELLEWGLGVYLEKHYNYAFDKDEVMFDNVHIKHTKDFGSEFVLSNEFMFEYLDFYFDVYSILEDEDKSELLLGKIEEFKRKLTDDKISFLST